jgi:ribosomal protein L16/L10AE
MNLKLASAEKPQISSRELHEERQAILKTMSNRGLLIYVWPETWVSGCGRNVAVKVVFAAGKPPPQGIKAAKARLSIIRRNPQAAWAIFP